VANRSRQIGNRPAVRSKRPRSARLVEAPAQPLPDAELEVLACLWQKADLTAAEIRQRLDAYRPMSHGSVLTLLKRLTAKNLVARDKAASGKAHVYRATRRPDRTYRRILESLVQRVFGGSRVAMVASLLDIGHVSPEDIQEMKQLLRQVENKQG